ncbi:MAG: TolC family protein [Fibrobacter sp.]|nr:TolC family protein [Fibrobacter sp.]
MTRYLLTSAIVIPFISVTLTAGQPSFKNLLISARNDPVVSSQDNKNAAVTKTFIGIPGIENIEFRVRNTGFDQNNFRYSLRLQPRGVLETRAAGSYNSSLITTKRMKRNLLLNIAIYNRYITFIDLLEWKTLLELYHELITLYDDRIKVLEESAYSEKFELEKLVKAEDDRSDEKVFSLEIEKNISVLEQRVAYYLGDSSFTSFDTSGLVSIETIIRRIETGTFSLDTNNAYLDFYRTEIDLARKRFDLEKAETRRYLDLISFNYDNGEMYDELMRKYDLKDYNLKKSFSIELGFRIPNLTLAAHELNSRRADLLKESEKYEKVKDELSEKVRKDLADLRQLIAQYRYLKERSSQVDVEASLKKFVQIDGIDPLVVLEIKEDILKNRISSTSIKYGIMRNYIYVIDNAGLLSQTPIRNYLSENMEIVEW